MEIQNHHTEKCLVFKKCLKNVFSRQFKFWKFLGSKSLRRAVKWAKISGSTIKYFDLDSSRFFADAGRHSCLLDEEGKSQRCFQIIWILQYYFHRVHLDSQNIWNTYDITLLQIVVFWSLFMCRTIIYTPKFFSIMDIGRAGQTSAGQFGPSAQMGLIGRHWFARPDRCP